MSNPTGDALCASSPDLAAAPGGESVTRNLLADAVELFELDDEANKPGTDTYTWLMLAREHLASPAEPPALVPIDVGLVDALRFYAEPQNYKDVGWQGDTDPAPVKRDCGCRARAALSRLEASQPPAETAPGVEWLGGFRANDPFGRCDARLPPSKAHELAPAPSPAPDAGLVEALLKEVAELPNPERTLLSHNERVLIEFCNRLGAALSRLEAPQPAAETARPARISQLRQEIEQLELEERLAKAAARREQEEAEGWFYHEEPDLGPPMPRRQRNIHTGQFRSLVSSLSGSRWSEPYGALKSGDDQ